MPRKPKRPCRHPGCPNLSDSTYCDVHAAYGAAEKRYAERARGSSAERGYDSRWRKARITFLRENPLCVVCHANGILTPATVVDHIIPHKGDKNLFWDVDNWQALCKPCHDRKTATEDRKYGR